MRKWMYVLSAAVAFVIGAVFISAQFQSSSSATAVTDQAKLQINSMSTVAINTELKKYAGTLANGAEVNNAIRHYAKNRQASYTIEVNNSTGQKFYGKPLDFDGDGVISEVDNKKISLYDRHDPFLSGYDNYTCYVIEDGTQIIGLKFDYYN